MAVYQFRLFGRNGKIVAVQQISAGSDQEAMSLARDCIKGAAAVAKYELWHGRRKVPAASPPDGTPESTNRKP